MLFNNLSTYFYLRPSTSPGKKGVLYLRVFVNSKILATSCIKNIRMHPEEFNVKAQKPTPNCECALVCTMFMNTVNEKLNVMHMDYEKKGGVLTKEAIFKALPGIYSKSAGEEIESLTFPGLYNQYLADQKTQIGKFISAGTYSVRTRYKKLFDKVLLDLNLITKPLINYTEDDVKTIQLRFMESHARGTVERSMFVFSSVFEFAVKQGHVMKNPCKSVKKIKKDENPDLVWLDPEELELLSKLELGGLEEKCRDAFVFCCWSGLSMGDFMLMNPRTSARQIENAQSAKAMEPAKIIRKKEGMFLCGRRRKTGTGFRVPLTSEAQRLIGKYGGLENLPYDLPNTGTILNLLMKLISVDKTIRFHTARKTFANYLLNEKMINPVYVIEMMGWKRIEEANPYVRIKESSLYRALSGQSI